MLEGKRRWLYMLAVLVVGLATDIVVTGGVSGNLRDIIIGVSGMYIAGDSYVKGKSNGVQ